MKLLLLEQDRDRKGSMLEIITKVLLSSDGYEYVATNEIGAGGNEIDVAAEKRVSTLGKTSIYPLICECKAHGSPITMNDWLKFLGKVYKEKRKNSLATGIMIALSDANGNVKGDFRCENYQDDVCLLAGKDLLPPIISHYCMSSNEELLKKVRYWTKKTVVDSDIAFHENSPYWIIYFSDGTFSVLDKDGESVQEDTLESILLSFYAISTYSSEKFVDLKKDNINEIKKKVIKNVAVWALMSGPLSFDTIIEQIAENSGGVIHVVGKEVEECLKELSFVEVESCVAHLKDCSVIDCIDFYRTLLNLGLPTKLYNRFYIDHIDNSLLDDVLHLQGSIVLSEEERSIVLFILKHSPSALRIVLFPNPLFKPRSRDDGVDIEALKDSIKSTFIQTISTCLEVDADSDIAMLLFDKLEIRDFYKQTVYQVVLKDGTNYTIPVTKRLYYIPFDDEEGGVVIQASKDFVGKYDSRTGYMISYKKAHQQKDTLFGIVKHKTGSDEEYLSLFG